MRGRLAALVGLALLLAGCGLPVDGDVHKPGAVPAEQRLPQPIGVLPPGPQPGATPEETVLGFLTAQSSARDQHGIARSFLTPDARPAWRDDTGVTVYDPPTTTTSPPQVLGDGTVDVALSFEALGSVGADGAARVQPPQLRTQHYRLRREAGQWRLALVPDGLTLSTSGRDRSYDPESIYFLAPPGPAAGRRHLVADLVELPAAQDRAQEVVGRLLAGPSSGLATSAQTAVPPGTRLRAPVATGAAGDVTVDLAVPGGLGAAAADLSAQLVWTLKDALPDFTRLRLLVEGAPLQVPGVGTPQPRGAWSAYAPDGPDAAPGIALVGGQLRSLTPPDPDAEPPALPQVVGAVDLAVDARRGRLAVLTQDGPTRTLRTGTLSTQPLVAGLQDPGLTSPTWGSGDLGLFLLRTGPHPAVLLVPTGGGAPVEVQVDGLPALDDGALLRVSRDGARVALVAGGVLQVGRIDLRGRVPHLVALRRLATGVLDVAWRTGTSLEVLVQDDVPPLLPLLQVSVDGTSSTPSGLVGVAEGDPRTLSAYGDQPLLVETTSTGGSTVYSGDGSAGFQVQLRDATRPSYAR